MRSIQSKFAMLSLLGIVLSVVIVGGFGLWSTARAQEDASDQILSLTCAQEASKLDQELLGIQSSVDSCADVVEENLPSPSSLADDGFLVDYLDFTERFVRSLAEHTEGVCTFYLRFEPDLCNDFAGFFYTRQGRYGVLRPQELTDITAYDPSDVEHVGWYYQPRAAGRPLWMDPYYNKNIGVYMVSYVVPLYVDGTFVGVVGMDVDFNVVISLMRGIRPYQTGKASLTSVDGVVYFHPDHESGTSIDDEVPSLSAVVAELPSLPRGASGGPVTYTHEGTPKKLAFSRLLNGMVLMISAEVAEINAPVDELLHTVALVGVVLSLLVIFAVLRASRRVTRPLVQLAGVADQIAGGNLDVELPEPTNDEVGALSRSLSVTLGSLRAYLSGLHDEAYRDALTKVKNKAAYDVVARRLAEDLRAGEAQFGLLMLDLNDLKVINDRHGHDRGDDYLRAGCALACDVFDHSPVFRIGGDEFVVVLEGQDYARREELLAAFDERMAATWESDEPWTRVFMAKGLAVCEPGDTTVEGVFHRADQAMYADKRRMKGEA